MTHAVIPYLKERFHLGDDIIHYLVLNATGLGESGIDGIIEDLIRGSRNPANRPPGIPLGHVRIRIAARGKNLSEARAIIAPAEAEIRSRLGDLIFGEGQDTLEGVVDRLVAEQGLRLSILETFSGGAAGVRMGRAASSCLAESRVMADPERFTAWLRPGGSPPLEEVAGGAARKLLAETGTGAALAVVGWWEKQDRRAFAWSRDWASPGHGG